MKFKVGDKVRIRKDAVDNHRYNDITLHSWMRKELKDVNMITWTKGDLCKVEANPYTYGMSMFEPVKEEVSEKLVIYRNDNKTIAKYYKGDKTFEAEAKCSSEDEYDFKTGAELAMNRVMDKAKEEDIGFGWVKCVGYCQKREFRFTVGKEYKIFNNGNITNDDGYTYAGEHSKKAMLDFLSKWYIFEEI